MNTLVILAGFLACLSFISGASIEEVSFVIKSDEAPEIDTKNIIGDTINSTIETIRGLIENFDPLALEDFERNIFELADVSIDSLALRGFSDFAMTDIGLNILSSSGTAAFKFDQISLIGRKISLTTDLLDFEATISSIRLIVTGLTIDTTLGFSLVPPQLTSLSALPQFQGLVFSIDADINGEIVDLEVDSELILAFINEALKELEETIGTGLMTIINFLIDRFL